MDRRFKGSLIDRLIYDDESCVAVIATGVICWLLPDAEFNGFEAFLLFLAIYMAVFYATHHIMAKIEKRKKGRYITVPRSEGEDVG